MAPKPPDARSAPAEPWHSSFQRLTFCMGAPIWPPNPPTLGAPRGAVALLVSTLDLLYGGPDMAPKPPDARSAPAKPWHSSFQRLTFCMGAPIWPPNPPTLGAPRRSRGTPRFNASPWAPIWPVAEIAATVSRLAPGAGTR